MKDVTMPKPKKNIFKRILIIVVDILVLLLVAYFILGYINFSRISKDEEPYLMEVKDSYQYDNYYVTVYDGKIYKIVKQEEIGKRVVLQLKLWFMDDVSKR